MLIRAERSSDIPDIQAVVDAAFVGDNGRAAESVLIERLRGGAAWLPQLALVADDDDQIVGQCLCTRAHVGDTPVLALGPISVVPGRQGAGIGTALLLTSIDIALDMSESLIGLVGDYDYYRKFGFVSGSSVGVGSPEPSWGDYFQVKILDGRRAPQGLFRYPTPFMEM